MAGFVDEAQIHVKAGDGGAGAVSFRREAHVSRGGPDGGDGGHGGDVWLVASRNQASLIGFRDHPHRRAADGKHGSGNKRQGASGADLEVEVPVGTVVRTREGAVEADLAEEGARWLAARGGRGGRGNASFLTNRRRAPSFAQNGERGEERWLNVELKLFADVALVGFPNAGKSTLISRISAAKPKIGDYPFTTLEPHLGVVRRGSAGDETEFVVADIPGLVEGASTGRGLGDRFLRHIERARVLVILLDLASAEDRSPEEQERVLLGELEVYEPALLERPRVVVGSKLDMAQDRAPESAQLSISSVTGEGIDRLVGVLGGLVRHAREQESSAAASVIVHRPLGEGFEIRREDDGAFVVEGRDVSRAVSLSDVSRPDALAYLQRRLRTLGVEKALVRAGVREGDTVRIGDMELEYHSDESIGPTEVPAKRRARNR